MSDFAGMITGLKAGIDRSDAADVEHRQRLAAIETELARLKAALVAAAAVIGESSSAR
jgi:hypothetical protein